MNANNWFRLPDNRCPKSAAARFAVPTVAVFAAVLPLTTMPAAVAIPSPGYESVVTSTLAKVALPKGALRLAEESVPKSVDEVLKTLVKAGGAGVRQGPAEVLAWTGTDFNPANFVTMRAKLGRDLAAAGWTYTEGDPETKETPFTLLTVMRTEPTRRGLIGVWAHADDTLMLAWTEILPAGSAAEPEPEKAEGHSIKAIFDGLHSKNVETPPLPDYLKTKSVASTGGGTASRVAPAASASATTFVVAPSQMTLNVMKSALTPLPAFPKLATKRNVVRGYVKDAKGNPLAGAVIGVRSSSAGGFYSGASGKSDAKGYYEIAAPWGAAEFYTASITRDYGDGRAAFGLHPADGEADKFATANGMVENWVLLPYGVADPDEASDQPQYSGNYYGGTFTVEYAIMDTRFPDNRSLPDGSEIEVTLIPTGPLIDGSKGRTFVIRRRIQEYSRTSFYVNNVPVGTYRVVATLNHNGQRSTLNIKESGPMFARPFGLEPKESRDGVTLTFRPGSAKTGKSAAGRGNWDSLQMTLTR